MKLAAFVALVVLGTIAYAQPATKPADEKHETLAEIKNPATFNNSRNRSHCGEYLAVIANRLLVGGLLGNLR